MKNTNEKLEEIQKVARALIEFVMDKHDVKDISGFTCYHHIDLYKALAEYEGSKVKLSSSDREKDLMKAKEWLNNKFRGKTIYNGHPLVVIDDLIDKALQLDKALQQQEVEEISETVFNLLLQQKAMTAKGYARQFPNGFKVVEDK